MHGVNRGRESRGVFPRHSAAPLGHGDFRALAKPHGGHRQSEEETGCKATPTRFAGCLCYTVGSSPKLVMFWEADLVKQGSIKDGGEGCSLHWMTLEEALNQIDYGDEKELLKNLGSGHYRY